MQNSMGMFTFSVFAWRYHFGQNWSKKSKLTVWAEIWICSIMQEICGAHFSCFRREKLFLNKSGQNLKTFSLSWNLVPKPIWVCEIQWLCSLFLFLTINIFLVCSTSNLIQRIIRICKIQCWCLFYLS